MEHVECEYLVPMSKPWGEVRWARQTEINTPADGGEMADGRAGVRSALVPFVRNVTGSVGRSRSGGY